MRVLDVAGRSEQTSGVRGWWLYILPLPLGFKAFCMLLLGNMGLMAPAAAAYALFLLAAWVAGRGFNREAAVHGAASSSSLPLKTIGGGLLGAATAFAATAVAGRGFGSSIALGVAAVIGFFFVYGFDRRVSRRLPQHADPIDDEVQVALREAHAKIEGIEIASRSIRSAEFRERLDRIVAGAEQILAAIEANPRTLRRARRFINVYLDGARQVSVHYARIHPQDAPPQLEGHFRELLVNMEAVCNEQQRRLADNDLADLDVQIEVLATRLKHEGVG